MEERVVRAKLLVVGSELLGAYKLDTNSLWISEQLDALGIRVEVKYVVRDELERLKEVIQGALCDTEVVISTGGLGPTEDDLTRQAFAEALGRPLVFDRESYEFIKQRFAKRGKVMSQNNARQAYFPQGAIPLPNPDGTAPGMMLQEGSTRIFVLPGPPREMKAMFLEQVVPRLSGGGYCNERKVSLHRTVKVTGIGESALDAVISPLYQSFSDLEITLTFTDVDIEVHLTARGEDARALEERLEKAAASLAQAIGLSCYSLWGNSLEEVVGFWLVDSSLTIAVAESVTAGLVASRIANVPGSSRYLRGGVVAYNREAKQDVLGVEPVILEREGEVSKATALAMAQRVRQLMGSDIGISTTGVAGPSGGAVDAPVGTVFVGLAYGDKLSARKLNFLGERNLVRSKAAQAALDLVRRTIQPGPIEAISEKMLRAKCISLDEV